MMSDPPSLEDMDSIWLGYPWGPGLDLSSLGSMQEVISHNPMAKESIVPIPVQGHFSDVPAAGPSQILGPA